MQEVWPGNINGLSMQDRFWVFYTDCWHEPNERNRILHFETLTWWPCDPSVRPGDYGIIYAKSPIKSIVAVVEVASDHFVYEGYDSCKITFDTILDPMLDLNDMKNSNELYNSWPLLRRNMQNPFGPQRLEKPALAALRTLIPQFDKMFKGS